MTDLVEHRTAQPRAKLVLVAIGGTKTEREEPNAKVAILRAEEAIQRLGSELREVKVVSRNRVVARWRLGRVPQR